MLDEIIATEKLAFAIGLSLILLSPVVLFIFPVGKWTAIVQAMFGVLASYLY